MFGSLNLRRENVPLAMQLKIDDLHAHLEPLDRYSSWFEFRHDGRRVRACPRL